VVWCLDTGTTLRYYVDYQFTDEDEDIKQGQREGRKEGRKEDEEWK
jgi:hypothetical protein